MKKLESVGEKVVISSLVAGVAIALPTVVQSSDIHKIFSISSDRSTQNNDLKADTTAQETNHYKLTLINEQGSLTSLNHSPVRRVQKPKVLNIGGGTNLETLSTVFINKEVNEILVNDYISVNIKEGQVFKYGDQGKAVEQLQQLLLQAGYYHSEIDGIFGQHTRDSVLQYQKDFGLRADGIFGTETYQHLLGVKLQVETNDINIPSPIFANYNDESLPAPIITEPVQSQKNNLANATLRNGDTGKAVEELQNLLKQKGYFSYKIDGVFGPATEAAVRNYQHQHELTSDGIAGKKTIRHLKKETVIPLPSRASQSPNPTKEVIKKETVSNSQGNTSILETAKSLEGTPYIWGGTTKNGFDCSGFLLYVYKQHGIDIPRTVSDIWDHATSVETRQPGDLVFFETYKKGPSHAGIYLGNNQFVHAGSSTGVTVSDLNTSYWKTRYLGTRRIK